MAINKVVYGNDTLIDLTNDTVEASNLLEGETAHDRSGTPVTGTAKQGHSILNKLKSLMTQRNKLWFKDAKVTDDSAEGATVVEVVQEMTQAEFDQLSAAEKKGIIKVTDANGRQLFASQVKMADGTSVQTAIEGLKERFDYSTDEQYGGKWIDGSDWYYKTIDFGALPNNTSKMKDHNISNFGHAIGIKCVAWRANGISVELPYVSTGYAVCSANSTQVGVDTTLNLSAYPYSAITVKYVKTS